jgi:hypothetical protein
VGGGEEGDIGGKSGPQPDFINAPPQPGVHLCVCVYVSLSWHDSLSLSLVSASFCACAGVSVSFCACAGVSLSNVNVPVSVVTSV